MSPITPCLFCASVYLGTGVGDGEGHPRRIPGQPDQPMAGIMVEVDWLKPASAMGLVNLANLADLFSSKGNVGFRDKGNEIGWKG